MAALLAEEISINEILVPPRPGALSALGAARADLEGDLVQPIYTLIDKLEPGRLAAELKRLEADSKHWIAEQTASLAVTDTRIEIAADMRYDGQGYDVTVALERTWLEAGDGARIIAAFHAAHRATYGHANADAEVWLKELRAHITGIMPKPRILPAEPSGRRAAPGTRRIRLLGRSYEAKIYEREDLAVGARIAGPAIVNQMDTTTLIPEGWHGETVASGALIVRRDLAEE
jgi:N-methylhydantoinase A